jgi:hypothetical protein
MEIFSLSPAPICKPPCTAKTQHRKFKTNIPRIGIARSQSQFPHSVSDLLVLYSHDWSAYSATGKYVDQSWEYINRSKTHECGNWEYTNGNFIAVYK